jgi:hypothetical protein
VTEEATETDSGEDTGWIKELRSKANEADKLRQEVNGLRRQIAMDDAGIPKTGAGKLFRKTWDGDPDDVAGLRSAAAEYELIPNNDDPDARTVEESIVAADRISETTQPTASTPTVDALLEGASSLQEIEQLARDAGFAASQS